MCGGIGKRMIPMTSDKSLLKFLGKPLIVHHIEVAREAGIDTFLVIVNPDNSENIKSALSEFNDIEIGYAIQNKAAGMSDALLSSAHLIADEPFILVNSNDIFTSTAYKSLLSEYNTNPDYSAYITAYQLQSHFPGGYLITNENDEIDRIIEKPPIGEEPSDLINIVIHLHTKPGLLFEYLTNTTSARDDIYEQALDKMIHDGYKCKAVPYPGPWQ